MLSPLNDAHRPSPSAVAAARRALAAALGPEKVIADPDLLDRYATDWSGGPRVLPDLVARAGSTAEVQQVLAIATEHRVPVTPRGLGTGKAGGAIPIYGGIVLALERMNRILEVSTEDMVLVSEPGALTIDVMRAAEAEELFYPPDPNSLHICSIGGNVACNAGGPRALKYGVTRHYVLGMEVVLPTGEILQLGRRTLKNVTGYDLTGVMVGSEGTLGVITKVLLKLIPRPRAVQTALVSFADTRAASVALTRVLAAGVLPRTLELLDNHALDAVRAKTPGRFPEGAGALIILETDGASEGRAFEDMEQAANICLEHGALDVQLAQDEAQRERMWEPRRVLGVTLSESSPKKISEDVVVPRSQIPALIDAMTEVGARHRLRVATYGHAGDGNLHVNVLFDESSADRAERAVAELMAVTVALGGTLTGEHGVGLLKRDFMHLEQPEPMLELQRRLKLTFDPAGILNPGKVLPARGAKE